MSPESNTKKPTIYNGDADKFGLAGKVRIEFELAKDLVRKIYSILKFSVENPWYDNEHARKCYELIEKGYTINDYQILRIENGYDMIMALKENPENLPNAN